MTDVRLGEVMTRDPLTSLPGDTLSCAAEAMRARGVGSTVVVDGDAVVGILTERDLVRAAAGGERPATALVSALMTPEPVTMSSNDSITHAIERMLDRRFRHIPVVDDGALVGIVSLRQLVEAARLRKVDPWSPGTGRGLENVTVARTELSMVDGRRGRLVYRGYDAVELAERASFEDAWHALYYGDLPRWPEHRFPREPAELRALPLDAAVLRDLCGSHGTLMAALQAAVAATAARWGLTPWLNADRAEVEAAALRLAGVVPTLVCAIWRVSRGLEPVDPDPALGHVANYLWMMHGERPADDAVTAMSRYLVLTMDHGMNASTFTARVVASTGADVGSAVAAAIGALSGPLHGGAPSLVADMLDQIAAPERAADWVAGALDNGRRIMGFGHRVYKTQDPRSSCLRRTARELGASRIDLAERVERAALDGLRARSPDYAYTNVEFYSAVVLEFAGVPRELFTPSFAVSRTVGWTAHVLEQVRDNRLIRPAADYTGPGDRRVG